MDNNSNKEQQLIADTNNKRKMPHMIKVGFALVIIFALGIGLIPTQTAGLFDAMLDRVMGIVPLFLTGTVGMAIIVGCLVGRILERLGFSDALVRIFLPATKLMRVNPTLIIPAIYNIIGDQQAMSKITVGTLLKGGASRDELKIAVATMVQAPNNFSTLMLAILCIAGAGVNVLLILVAGIILPLLITPIILRNTIWRDASYIPLESLPCFITDTDPLSTVFDSAREGVQLAYLLVLPSVAAVFAFIGALEYLGAWKYIMDFFGFICDHLWIDPDLGVQIIFISPTLAVANLSETFANFDPRIVVGSTLLALSGLPFVSLVGQLPVIWSTESNNKIRKGEVIVAGWIGILLKFIYTFIIVSIMNIFM
ncbi:MAG: hypothetical protein GX076_10055 [Clostridiales bacterium]|jgi:hypothetical protein|nr:hypothetical protein [Clostridiales bacterium]